jgi:hypothetical protein
MDGLGLDNMLGADELNKMFSNGGIDPSDDASEPDDKAEKESNKSQGDDVDFSDSIGIKPDSIDDIKEGEGDTPDSSEGTPQPNAFSSIAKALKDEGVFPDLSDDVLKNIKDASTFKKMFDDEISKSLDDRQKKIEAAINGGATSEELQQYQNAVNLTQYLNSSDTINTLSSEGDEGEDLRKRIIYQDLVNRGFRHERAVKMVEKSLADGTDIEDAKEAMNSCREFYNKQVEDYQKAFKEKEEKHKKDEDKRFSNLKKKLLDNDSFYNGVKVSKDVRQRAYDAITKPIAKDDNGNYINTLQKYQKEHPDEYMENMALLYAITDGFKSIEKLTKGKVNSELKKGFAELEGVLNSTLRNGDGSLNLANAALDDSDREKWTLG